MAAQIQTQTPKPEKEGVFIDREVSLNDIRKGGDFYGVCTYSRRDEKVR